MAPPEAAPPLRLRRHQELSLAALDQAWAAGRVRALVELPPGAGKTLVGLETARRLLADARVRKVVVLGPNTAIQGQWATGAARLGLRVTDDRLLPDEVTALTYQSLAVFDADDEVDDDAIEQDLLSRLHDNGAALVRAMQDAGPLLLVLDECHHLLEVWGRLLGEVLDQLPQARVLGLTATPPESLTTDQAALVADLFGETVFEASIPAAVREGDLAPFAELAWLVTPTASEEEWLAGQAARFTALVHQLTDPAFGSTPFLSWVDARFLSPDVGWAEIARGDPPLARAALRLHHAGLLELPVGARVTEEVRTDPTADDWVLLVDDWLRRGLALTGDAADDEVVAAVRRALPSVGFQWTKRGIRRGRSTVDRVLARSAAKTVAAVQIAATEHLNLGDRLRLLMLCDHEEASATLPADLDGVIDAQTGSARAVLSALREAPDTAVLGPLLVTGRTVAGDAAVVERLRDFVATRDATLAAGLTLVAAEQGDTVLGGSWTSRQWVPHVTAFFESGGCRVLVGTRGLLGEGWDARSVSGLVDLTAVTTSTAVVQTRGRALRTDPAWPDKVALTWSVVCVAPGHPKGANDWDRLVRKHDGFYGVDDAGDVVDGVGHLDAAFSPYAPPPLEELDAVNARMVLRSEDRAAIAARWRVGAPYDDRVTRTLRLLPSPTRAIGDGGAAPAVVVRPGALVLREGGRPSLGAGVGLLSGLGAAGLGAGVLATSTALATTPVPGAAAVAGLGSLAVAAGARGRSLVAHGRDLLAEAALPPGIGQIARAVADAMRVSGLLPVGAEAVRVDVEPDGEYRCTLQGVTEDASAQFALALDEALSPIVRPRYVVPRWTLVTVPTGWWAAVRASYGRITMTGETWHPVPTVLGVNAQRAQAYGRAWVHWVGGGDALYTGSAEGAGVLAAQQGADPFDVTTVLRRHWA
ncbi:MAG: DEAD/DEAH box helicase family protein [Nocardioidaceae bacterium]|nr:DEAD/DEAH box helicase family protein [Nocardioidaceae bacterium]